MKSVFVGTALVFTATAIRGYHNLELASVGLMVMILGYYVMFFKKN